MKTHYVFIHFKCAMVELRAGAQRANATCNIRHVTIEDDYSLPHHIDGLAQDCSNSSAIALELLQSCAKPSTCTYGLHGTYRLAAFAEAVILVPPHPKSLHVI